MISVRLSNSYGISLTAKVCHALVIVLSNLCHMAPDDIAKFLDGATGELNAQLPWSYKVTTRTVASRSYYSFVPARHRNEAGELKDQSSYLDTRIDIRSKRLRSPSSQTQ